MPDTTELAYLIAEHYPALTIHTLAELPHRGWGGDSDVVLVNGTLIFRFPRNDAVARSLSVEVCLLPQLAPLTGTPIPAFTHIARAAQTGAPLFAGYPILPGEPLTADLLAAADPGEVALIAAQLGAFLSALHTFPVERARSCGTPGLAGSLRERAAAHWGALYRSIGRALDDGERATLDRTLTAYLDTLRGAARTAALCHGDLSSDHILVDATASGSAARTGLSGVIDFGDLAIGNPAGDFTWRTEYGDAFFNSVLDYYTGAIGDRTAFAHAVWLRSRLSPVFQIAYGLDQGSDGDIEEGRAALRALLRQPPP